jgi:hypothetical protein
MFKRPQHWIVWSRGHLQCHHVHTRFHPNPLIGSKVIKGFPGTHLRSLNVCHFGMAKATRLNNVASRSSSMAATAYQISVQELLVEDTQTDRQAGDLKSLLTFLESRLKMLHFCTGYKRICWEFTIIIMNLERHIFIFALIDYADVNLRIRTNDAEEMG